MQDQIEKLTFMWLEKMWFCIDEMFHFKNVQEFLKSHILRCVQLGLPEHPQRNRSAYNQF
jgi:hypothetical protein